MITQSRLLLRDIRAGLVDLIFPPTCVNCARVGSFLCSICREDEIYAIPHALPQIEGIAGFTAVGLHRGAIRAGVHALKYEDVRGVAHPLAELLVPHIQWTFDAIIPVPLHYLRLQKRGYNQANLLAQALSERIRIPVLEDILIRTRATTSQVELSAAERRENVAEAFSINGNVPPRVLLIDDVCTTGSTLTAAAQALQQADVKTIYAATVSLAS